MGQLLLLDCNYVTLTVCFLHTLFFILFFSFLFCFCLFTLFLVETGGGVLLVRGLDGMVTILYDTQRTNT